MKETWPQVEGLWRRSMPGCASKTRRRLLDDAARHTDLGPARTHTRHPGPGTLPAPLLHCRSDLRTGWGGAGTVVSAVFADDPVCRAVNRAGGFSSAKRSASANSSTARWQARSASCPARPTSVWRCSASPPAPIGLGPPPTDPYPARQHHDNDGTQRQGGYGASVHGHLRLLMDRTGDVQECSNP